MRYYPLHIITKNLVFLALVVLIELYSGTRHLFQQEWWSTGETLAIIVYLSIGLIIIDLFIYTAVYLIMGSKRKGLKSFWVGVTLHLPVLLILWVNSDPNHNLIGFLIASALSLIVSGYVYNKLNSGFSFEKMMRRIFGTQ
jgi:hypothetical protein